MNIIEIGAIDPISQLFGSDATTHVLQPVRPPNEGLYGPRGRWEAVQPPQGGRGPYWLTLWPVWCFSVSLWGADWTIYLIYDLQVC